MPLRKDLNSILIIGSGPIIIGQACEFDYSGSQALRSLKEDGIETILINSNPATIMTDPVMADHIYLLPLTTKSIKKILTKHKIDAVLPTMGGQTALNLCIEADEKGIWDDFDVEIIGVDIDAIQITEDREKFRLLLDKIDIPYAPSETASSFLKGKEIAQELIIDFVKLNHPGGAIGYKIQTDEVSVVFIFDNEITEKKKKKLIPFCENVNIVFWDGMFTDQEYKTKKGWGHSTIEQGRRFSKKTKPKKLYICHHSPSRKDSEIDVLAELNPEDVIFASEKMKIKL